MDLLKIEASSRSETGKGAARKLRQSGRIPGVAYGLDRQPQPLVVSEETVRKLMRAGAAVLVDLAIDEQPPQEGVAAIVKAIDLHPVTWAPLSIDFQWVSLTEAVEVPVPLVTIGEALGTTQEDGVIEQHLYEVTVRCLPTEIPDRLELDISQMVIGDTLHISDVPTPEGVEIVNDPEEAVISCLAPRIVEEEEPEAAEEVEGELAEGEEAAEGEAAEGEGEAGEGEGEQSE